MLNPPLQIAIVGTGPAALMAADRLAHSSRAIRVTLFEKRGGIAWKLFVAGSSGLNITNSLDLDSFSSQYTGPADHWKLALDRFSNKDWVRFLEDDLDQKTFLGTSGRYFVETMHAAKLVRAWKKRLENAGVAFRLQHELSDLNLANGKWTLSFIDQESFSADLALLCLGGGSYEPHENPLRWPKILSHLKLGFTDFSAVNTGYHVAWSEGFIKEADGLPLKNVVLSNAKGARKGDLIVSEYGLEGTPIYTLGQPGPASLDLKPDLSADDILKKLNASKENLSPIRRVQKYLGLNKTALALLFHMAPSPAKSDLLEFIRLIKAFPLELLEPRPLVESISSRGGLSWSDLDENLQIKSNPGLYAAGEMIDWEAPTGGFLIQGAVSQGALVADKMIESFGSKP
ncbi:MAG: TIGR03862 family flavoprotein [Proteobacteria bacterium]|nr:MAG: TIGR03862 family flavoprotein [Pseudomonadota bacterium]